MIGKVMRGRDVAGLLRYLFGPGRADEHTEPRLVATWDGEVVGLQAGVTPGGRHDVRHLAGLLEQPLLGLHGTPPEHPVWHCALRAAPGDRVLGDAEWRDIARDVVARTGLSQSEGDSDGCRWVTVRHADDHVHVVVTLGRQDGRRPRLSNDYYRVGEACRAAEERLGLRATAPRDRTAARRPDRGEIEKAGRAGRHEPARTTLQREVRTAAAGAASLDEFLARLTGAGLLVRQRRSVLDPDVVTGYAVAVPGDRAGNGRPVWFGGGRLAADLSLPRLRVWWSDDRPAGGPSTRRALWERAAREASTAAADVRRLAQVDPAAAADMAAATGATLSVTARAFEGRRGGPVTAAADLFDRAAREAYARPTTRRRTGTSLRIVARLLAATGRAGRDETTQVMALLLALSELSAAVADLREVQNRAAQARAARDAASELRRATGTTGAVHSPPWTATVHTLPPRLQPVEAQHRRVRT